MKLHILSDLHLEFQDFEPPLTDADVVILAGDIHVGKKGIPWMQTHFPDQPVIYILGNHEYYSEAYPKHVDDLKQLAAGSNIHILENESFRWGDLTFLGCTLWTDFKLLGDPQEAGFEATLKMNDYRRIRVSPAYRKLRSIDTAILHRQSLQWLQGEAAQLKQNNEKFVIITHHAPSQCSVPERYKTNILSAAYASHLDPFVEASGAQAWIHGHIHIQQTYQLGNTRVITNPRGYPKEASHKFIPNLVVEV